MLIPRKVMGSRELENIRGRDRPRLSRPMMCQGELTLRVRVDTRRFANGNVRLRRGRSRSGPHPGHRAAILHVAGLPGIEGPMTRSVLATAPQTR